MKKKTAQKLGCMLCIIVLLGVLFIGISSANPKNSEDNRCFIYGKGKPEVGKKVTTTCRGPWAIYVDTNEKPYTEYSVVIQCNRTGCYIMYNHNNPTPRDQNAQNVGNSDESGIVPDGAT